MYACMCSVDWREEFCFIFHDTNFLFLFFIYISARCDMDTPIWVMMSRRYHQLASF